MTRQWHCSATFGTSWHLKLELTWLGQGKVETCDKEKFVSTVGRTVDRPYKAHGYGCMCTLSVSLTRCRLVASAEIALSYAQPFCSVQCMTVNSINRRQSTASLTLADRSILQANILQKYFSLPPHCFLDWFDSDEVAEVGQIRSTDWWRRGHSLIESLHCHRGRRKFLWSFY